TKRRRSNLENLMGRSPQGDTNHGGRNPGVPSGSQGTSGGILAPPEIRRLHPATRSPAMKSVAPVPGRVLSARHQSGDPTRGRVVAKLFSTGLRRNKVSRG